MSTTEDDLLTDAMKRVIIEVIVPVIVPELKAIHTSIESLRNGWSIDRRGNA